MGSRLLWSIFQFTPLREGRRVLLPSPSPSFYFNSRPSARGDSACCLQVHALTAFQFTPLREGRRSSVGRRRTSPNFNSRPSARGDDVTAAKYYGVALFQFTPLREGRPGQQKAPERGDYFNSRPSARGDSALRPAARSSVSISIHAPPRGATRSYWDGTISG